MSKKSIFSFLLIASTALFICACNKTNPNVIPSGAPAQSSTGEGLSSDSNPDAQSLTVDQHEEPDTAEIIDQMKSEFGDIDIGDTEGLTYEEIVERFVETFNEQNSGDSYVDPEPDPTVVFDTSKIPFVRYYENEAIQGVWMLKSVQTATKADAEAEAVPGESKELPADSSLKSLIYIGEDYDSYYVYDNLPKYTVDGSRIIDTTIAPANAKVTKHFRFTLNDLDEPTTAWHETSSDTHSLLLKSCEDDTLVIEDTITGTIGSSMIINTLTYTKVDGAPEYKALCGSWKAVDVKNIDSESVMSGNDTITFSLNKEGMFQFIALASDVLPMVIADSQSLYYDNGYKFSFENNSTVVSAEIIGFDEDDRLVMHLHIANGSDVTFLAVTFDKIVKAEPSFDEIFTGSFTTDDGHTLTVSKNSDDTYTVDINILNLAEFKDSAASVSEDGITFNSVDASGNPVSGLIYKYSNNSLNVICLESEWDLFPVGDIVFGFNKLN